MTNRAMDLSALTMHNDNVRRAEQKRDRAALIARDNGATWLQIGEALGTSKQAAQQRYSRGTHTDEHFGTACAENADRVGDTDEWTCRICGKSVVR